MRAQDRQIIDRMLTAIDGRTLQARTGLGKGGYPDRRATQKRTSALQIPADYKTAIAAGPKAASKRMKSEGRSK